MAPADDVRRLPNFPFPRQENENIAAPGAFQFLHGVRNRFHPGFIVRFVHIFHRTPTDFHGIGAPGNRKDRRRMLGIPPEMLRKAFGINRGRRDDHFEVRTSRQQLLEVPQEKIDVDRTFVRFVDDDRVVAL